MLTESFRSRWFAALFHAGLWILLGLALATLGGRAPKYLEAASPTPAEADPIPTGIIQRLFTTAVPIAALNSTNLLDPFFTKNFLPPVLPPPTTRRVELTYHGFFQTAEGPKTALVKVGDTIFPITAGARAVADLAIADMNWQTLTLTNAAAQTNALQLNLKKEMIVPIQ